MEQESIFLYNSELLESVMSMFYNQYPYTLFSQKSLDDYIRHQQDIIDARQHRKEQQENIDKMRKAIKDYCHASKKITPDYQQQAINACLEEIILQAMQDGCWN